MSLPSTALELRGSGIQLTFKYLGNVPIEAALHDMTTDLRPLVVKECINMIAAELGMIKKQEINEIVRRVVGTPVITNIQVDFNITNKALTIIHAESSDKDKCGGLLARHHINLVSFAAQGDESNPATNNIFAYVAKKMDESDRRCFIFQFNDVQRVMQIIDDAIRLATQDRPMPPPIMPTSGIVIVDRPFVSGVNDPRRTNRGIRQPSPRNGIVNTDYDTTNGLNEDPNGLLGLDLLDKPWYHGDMNRSDAVALLKNDGDFLVRKSANSPGQFILGGMENGQPRHILLIDKNVVRTLNTTFPTVTALIEFHQQNHQPISTEESTVYLINPIHKL